MPYQPHWERPGTALRSRAEQISDEKALDRRIPRLKKRVTATTQPKPVKKAEPGRGMRLHI